MQRITLSPSCLSSQCPYLPPERSLMDRNLLLCLLVCSEVLRWRFGFFPPSCPSCGEWGHGTSRLLTTIFMAFGNPYTFRRLSLLHRADLLADEFSIIIFGLQNELEFHCLGLLKPGVNSAPGIPAEQSNESFHSLLVLVYRPLL